MIYKILKIGELMEDIIILDEGQINSTIIIIKK